MEYKLEELFDLQMGKTPSRNNPEYWNSADHKWISIGDLSKCGKYITETKEFLSDKAVEKSGISLIPENTVVMSFKLSIGKTAITPEPMYSNEAIMSFRDKHLVELMPDYLYYLLSGKDWDVGTNKAVMGKTLNKATLSKVKVKIHDISEQHNIVQVLDRVKAVIDARQLELQRLDELIKARFVEMFGDEKNQMVMSDVCSIITDGTHQPPKFKDEGIPFIFVSNITGDKVTYDAEKFIDQDTYDELIKRTPIEIGDVLLSTVGSYGHPAVVKSDKKFLFQRHIAYLKPRREIVDSDYLHGAILSPDAQGQIERGVKGIAQKTLNLSEIKKMMIPLPAMDKQKQFSSFVAQVDKSKVIKEFNQIIIINSGVREICQISIFYIRKKNMTFLLPLQSRQRGCMLQHLLCAQ